MKPEKEVKRPEHAAKKKGMQYDFVENGKRKRAQVDDITITPDGFTIISETEWEIEEGEE